MLSPSYSISPKDLWNAIATPSAPQLVDVRRRDAYEQSPQLLPGALWRDAGKTQAWSAEFDRARPIVAACKAGHEMSQTAVAQLRADGFDARVLEGGYEAWAKAGLPFVAKPELDRLTPKRPGVWVTRRRPKIDRIACPWLIRRFLDPQARILFVDPTEVVNVARESGGVPFDIKDVELSHDGERCSFDTMLKLFGLEGEPSLGAAGPDRARRRHRAARFRAGSGRAACDFARPVGAGRRRRSWAARTRFHGLRCPVRLAALRRRGTSQLAGQGGVKRDDED